MGLRPDEEIIQILKIDKQIDKEAEYQEVENCKNCEHSGEEWEGFMNCHELTPKYQEELKKHNIKMKLPEVSVKPGFRCKHYRKQGVVNGR